MFGCVPASFILGVRMQAAQSRVGNVLSNWAMWPPIDGSRSTRWTGKPASASSRAAVIPAMPPPTTSDAGWIGTRNGSRGACSSMRYTPPAMTALALAVAAGRSVWTHETCSRIETSSHRYGLSPARWHAPRNVFSCMWGEQAATTTRLSPSSLMSFSISSWPVLEHMNL